MLQNLTGWHALIILAIVVLIFGAAKLPALAKSVGQSMRILKTEVSGPAADTAPETAPRPVTPRDARAYVDAVAADDLARRVARAAE
ncbi:twin-arginine translocase TatA/TatE family subunit [Microbacterium sp. 22215]|uniref:twin-arginine translocase TatA/TatE family subunit n=1 Tax=Microbacterium sp. 22215 TaxID=3453893 RepID=UPI003F84D099